MKRPRVGVSSCLLGRPVRYDGGHKLDPFVSGPLAEIADLVPVCPEVELGLGVPRPPVRLERAKGGVRMIGVETRVDHTAAMEAFAERRVAELESLDLGGYVFKKNSPSCGPEGVPILGSTRPGRGLFAAALQDAMPLLPIVDEAGLLTHEGQDHFVERVLAYRRVTDFFRGRWTIGKLVAFHASEKLLLMAHEPAGYAELGRLVAGAKGMKRDTVREKYQRRYTAALAKPATVGRHVNVLQHLAGYFKGEDLQPAIDCYRRGETSLEDVKEFFRRRARKAGVAYLEMQTYLKPNSP